jgi:hypothetical protein
MDSCNQCASSSCDPIDLTFAAVLLENQVIRPNEGNSPLGWLFNLGTLRLRYWDWLSPRSHMKTWRNVDGLIEATRNRPAGCRNCLYDE